MAVFSPKGAEKRKQHGSKGATVFRDPNEDDRVWVLFDWDESGWQNFVSDPEVPAILQEAGHKGRPQAAGLRGRYDAYHLSVGSKSSLEHACRVGAYHRLETRSHRRPRAANASQNLP